MNINLTNAHFAKMCTVQKAHHRFCTFYLGILRNLFLAYDIFQSTYMYRVYHFYKSTRLHSVRSYFRSMYIGCNVKILCIKILTNIIHGKASSFVTLSRIADHHHIILFTYHLDNLYRFTSRSIEYT